MKFINILQKKHSPPSELSKVCMLSSLSLLKIIFNKRCPLLLRIHVIFMQLTSILLWFDHNTSSQQLRFIDIFTANLLFFHCVFRFYKIKEAWLNVDIPLIFVLNTINYKFRKIRSIENHLTFISIHSIFHFRAIYCIDKLIYRKY